MSGAAYYQANRDALREKQRLYRAANRARINARQAAWRAANRERAVGATRQWRSDNPEAAAAHARTDNHRRRGARVNSAYAEILLRDPCSYCGAPADTIDHITAVTRGGKGGYDITSACGTCNSSKGNDSLLMFLLRRNA